MDLSFKHFYWRWTKNLFLLLIFFLILMTIARISFSLAFGEWSELRANLPAFKKALWLGLRYDLMPLSYINILPFILINLGYFLPGKSATKILRLLIIAILFLGYVFLIWVYIFDYAFYSYFQDHLNILSFGFLEDDTVALLTSIWKNYNLPLWLTVILLGHYALLRLIKLFFSLFDFDLSTRKFDFKVPLFFILGLSFLGLAGRGNYTRLPLSIEDAHISANEFINKLSLNGVLTLNRAIKIRKTFGTKDVDYLKRGGFSDWKDAFKIAFQKEPKADNLIESLKTRVPFNPEVDKNPPHIVVVIMESFGSYWNPYHSDSFNILGSLESHFKEGLLFNNFLPAENGTIGSVVSIATSQVIRPGARFLSESNFMREHLRIASHLPFKQAGYETHFLYGGKLGWRDLGKYLALQKYDALWGADEVKEAIPELQNIEGKDLGNEWGIFDEYLYAFIEEQLRTASRPQFFLVLTTSNHPPFEYPSSYNTLPLEMDERIKSKVTIGEDLAKKRFLGLQYANHKAGEFITRIKNSALNEKVVVALTGDHSYWIAKGVGHNEEFKRYAVPLFIALPDRMKPVSYKSENFGSHEDIFPTLYHLTLSNQEYIKLGEDLLNEEGIALNSSGLIANKDGAFHHQKYWRWSENKPYELLETKVSDELRLLHQRGQGMIGLTDYYLKEERKNNRKNVEN